MWQSFCSGLNSLRPSDAIWRRRSGSTLAQVMACSLTTPSHYLNVTFILGQFHKICLHHQSLNLFENYMPKISFKFPRGQWVNEWGTRMKTHPRMLILFAIYNSAPDHAPDSTHAIFLSIHFINAFRYSFPKIIYFCGFLFYNEIRFLKDSGTV